MANTKTYFNTITSVDSVDDSNIIVVQTADSASLATMAKTTVGALRAPLKEAASSNASLVSSEASRAASSEASLAEAIASEASRAKASEASLSSSITAAIDALDTTGTYGGNGKYIKQISEENGIIVPVEETLETDIENNSTKAPTTSAIKTFVESKINGLDLNEVGGTGRLVQSVSQANGKISATAIELDSNLSSSPNKVPTSEAIYNAINSLDGEVGGTTKLVKKVEETNGKISGETIDLVDTVTNNPNAVPTSLAVYNKLGEFVTTALDALDYSSGAAGYYFDSITQNNGKILTTSKKFDTYSYQGGTAAGTWSSGAPSDLNTPTSQAVKNYTDYKAAVIDNRIDNTNYSHSQTQTGVADGTYLLQVTQSSGAIKASKAAFENATIASYVNSVSASSGSYAGRVDTAPTVRAVTEQIKRLDGRIDEANAGLTALSTGPFGSTGAYISKVEQRQGYISASTTNFATSIKASTTEADNVPPTEHAVRSAINALDVAQIGANGSYIRFVVETDGKISATPVGFDHFDAACSASAWDSVTNNNSPSTLAVKNFVLRVKSDILEDTKAMTYEGTVGSLNALKNKKPFNQGDTYIATAKFNLESDSGVQVKYNVNKGDMLICKNTPSPDPNAYDKDNFDIIGGSEYQIVFNGTTSVVNNIPVFDSTNGTVLKDSGESIDTVIQKSASAASAAACSASAAACAASSAIFADLGVEPYINSAASAASAADAARSCSASAATAADGKRSCSASAATAANTARASAVSAATAADTARSCSASAATAANTARACSASAATAASNSATAADTARACSASSATAAETARSCSASAAAAADLQRGIAKSNADAAIVSANTADTARACAASAATTADGKRSCSASAATAADTARACAASSATAASGSANTADTSRACSASAATAANTARANAATSAGAADTARACAASAATAADAQRGNAATSAGAAANSATAAATSAGAAADSATAAETARSCSASAATAADGKRSCSASAATAADGKRSCSASAATAAETARSCAASAATAADTSRSCSASAATAADGERSCSASAATVAETARSCSASAATAADTARASAASAATAADTARASAASAATAADTARASAASSATAASGSATTADTARASAASAATAADTARASAASAATAADTARASAASSATAADTSAACAASFAAAANLNGIKDAASLSASRAASSASCSSSSAQVSACAASKAYSCAASYADTKYTAAASYANTKVSKSGDTMSGGLYLPSLTASGNIIASSFEANSSRKLKENINPVIISALDIIKDVNVVNFNYINDEEKTPHIGFIAEDTDKILSTPHMNKMDYTNCIGVLLKAVQEITKGIDKLEKRIDKIEK